MVSATLDLFATGARDASENAAVRNDVSRVDSLVTIVEGVAGVEALEPVWRRIARASPDQSAFLGYAFALAAARYHEARSERVLAAVAEWGGRPALILPIAVARRGGVTVGVLLGDPLAQYGDALMVRNAPPRTADLALTQLAQTLGVDVFEFRRVRADAAIAPALSRFAKHSGPAVAAPYADLFFTRDADAFLASVQGAKQKRERLRSRRRLAEKGEVAFDALRGAEAIEALRDAFAMKRAWLARQGLASAVIDDPRALAAFESVARDRNDGGGIMVARLSVAGVPAAYEVGLVRGRRFHAYLGVVAQTFAAASPGKIVMEETLGWCVQNGVDVYDLLPPSDAYKARWSNASIAVRNYVRPLTLKGRLYAGPWLSGIRPRLRAALDSLPSGLRRRLGQTALRAGAA